jgi:hypothetical protein
MNKKFIYLALLSASVIIFSCQDEDTKAPQMLKDSLAKGNGSGSDTSATNNAGSSKNNSAVKDTSVSTMPVVKSAGDNTKIKTPVKSAKKIAAAKDSATADDIPAVKKTKIPSADNTKTTVADNTVTAKPFVSKYGTIPRSATQDNITEFLIAFTDKNTFIKIYYNADPDAEMQTVRAQIVKVLRKSGYTNVSDQFLTLHPMHVPKDVHYELQHDGSVIIWIPPASAE